MGLSADEQSLDQVGKYTYAKLEAMKANLNRRDFRGNDGNARIIDQVAQLLHEAISHMHITHIEDSTMSWP